MDREPQQHPRTVSWPAAEQCPVSGRKLAQGQPQSLVSGLPLGLIGGVATGGLLGLLAGNKKARETAGEFAGTAVAIGGTAALGALAYTAYQRWQSNNATAHQSRAEPANVSAALPAAHIPARFDIAANPAADGQPFQLAIVKAMIAASNADGHIDADEQRAIFDAVSKLDLDAESKALIFDTLRDPPDVRTIASYAVGIEQATELYVASRLAIDPNAAAGRAYLSTLSAHLSLPDGLAAQIESQFTAPARNAA